MRLLERDKREIRGEKERQEEEEATGSRAIEEPE